MRLSEGSDGLTCVAIGLPLGTGLSFDGQPEYPLSGGLSRLTAPTAAVRTGRVDITLRAAESPLALRCSLPRPSRLGLFVDEADRVLATDLELDLDEVLGWRVMVPGETEGHLQIRLHAGTETSGPKPILRMVVDEVGFGTLMPLLRAMLAIGGPDAELRLRVLANGTQSPRLTVRRFQRSAVWLDGGLVPARNSDELDANLDLHCLNLSAPGESLDLAKVATGSNIAPLLPRHPGPWMILPSDSRGQIRPPRPISLPPPPMTSSPPGLVPHSTPPAPIRPALPESPRSQWRWAAWQSRQARAI